MLAANKVNVLLLEGVHQNAIDALKKRGFNVDWHKSTLDATDLKQKIKSAHFIGIRSRTNLTKELLAEADNLLAVGCFCIGTNQVDLETAAERGIPVFNSPFANSRSVAELLPALVVALSRRLGDANTQMHAGLWNKSSKGCREVRGKTLGIVGYGHVGTQVSVLAEAYGMDVLFYDVLHQMPIGKAQAVETLEELLKRSDFVTLHVPLTDDTVNMMRAEHFAMMKKGSFFINYARGTVVDLDALVDALKSGHLAGAAVDVFPSEPKKSRTEGWHVALQGLPNVILTPHIGGSTEEAQAQIGQEVSDALITYYDTGVTQGAVNFPKVMLEAEADVKTHRICNVHRNVPGVMRAINNVCGDYNIEGQSVRAKGKIGYVIIDVDHEASEDMLKELSDMDTSIRTRLLS